MKCGISAINFIQKKNPKKAKMREDDSGYSTETSVEYPPSFNEKGGYLSVNPIAQQFTRTFQRITPTWKSNKPLGYLPVKVTNRYTIHVINGEIIPKK